MRTVDLLRELQDLDSHLEGARASLVQLRLEIGERSALDRTEHELGAAREELHRIEVAQRDLELQAESLRARIAGEEKRLYGGTITNPKELSALAQEIGQEKRRLDGIEDRLLALLEEGESRSERVAQLEAALARQTEAWKTSQTQARRRSQDLEGTLHEYSTRREALATQVEGPARALYDNLRRQKGGIAVAHVLQRTCQSCRVALTPALEQRARIGAELVPCHSCGRILFISIS